MAAGDLITQDWEAEFDSLLLGAGSDYPIVKVEGLADLPALSSSDSARMRRHGEHAGDDFLGSREVILTLEMVASTDSALNSMHTALKRALRPARGEKPLVMRIPGIGEADSKVRIYARPRAISAPLTMDWFYRVPVVMVRFHATDPRIYRDTERSSTADLATAGGGLNFNLTFNASFGAIGDSGSIIATHNGTFPSPWVAKIDGPCSSPRIENVTQGKLIKVNLTLATGEYLVLDSDARSVLLGGTASRYNYLDSDSEWFDLDPGGDQITFRAATGTSAQMTLSWRDAWL